MDLFDLEREESDDSELSNAELINRESFERLNSRNRARKIRQTIFYVTISVIIFALSLMICVVLFFRVKSIDVTGNAQYDKDTILEKTGLKLGTNLLAVDIEEAENALLNGLTYLRSAKVSRVYPDKLSIEITEDKAKWYTKIWDEWFILSENLRVVEKVSDEELAVYIDEAQVKWIKLPDINRAVTGELIVMNKTTAFEYTIDFLEELQKQDIFEKLEYIDCSDRYHISVYMDSNRCKCIIGDSDNMQAKFKLIYAILDDETADITSTTIFSIDAEYVSPVIVCKQDELFVYG